MKEEIILAGFGGQGIMLMGKLLAYAGMKEGYEVSWIPSYGPAMRGGTANCTVVISSEKIPSPMSSKPDSIIVMNLPSLEKFESCVKKAGSIFINTSLIEKEVERSDVNTIVKLPANEVAKDIGNIKIANMVMLGAYLANNDFMSINTVKESLSEVLSKRRQKLIPINKKALDAGARFLNAIKDVI